MKVILLQDVKDKGKKGQLVEVNDGYGRNYLIPRNLAMLANTDNINALKIKEKADQARIAKEKEQATQLGETLKNSVVKVHAKAGATGKLFGAVTAKEVAEALLAQFGIDIDSKKITMGDPIKNFGSYELKVKLYADISATLYIVVVEA